jgi:restriction endonuclease Mrr
VGPFCIPEYRIERGQRVIVRPGPSSSFKGEVVEINNDRKTVVIETTMLGGKLRIEQAMRDAEPIGIDHHRWSIRSLDRAQVLETLGVDFRRRKTRRKETIPEPVDVPGKEEETENAQNLGTDSAIVREINIELSAINEELVRYLAANPECLYRIDPYRFEELVAELQNDMGYRVQLTKRSGDNGRDILALFKVPMGEILTVVECKRYAPDNVVGLDIVERFLYTISRDRANCGMIATTSSYSSGARARATEHRLQLQLKDFGDVRDWLRHYGTWAQHSSGGLWIPNIKLNNTVREESVAKELDRMALEEWASQ